MQIRDRRTQNDLKNHEKQIDVSCDVATDEDKGEFLRGERVPVLR